MVQAGDTESCWPRARALQGPSLGATCSRGRAGVAPDPLCTCEGRWEESGAELSISKLPHLAPGWDLVLLRSEAVLLGWKIPHQKHPQTCSQCLPGAAAPLLLGPQGRPGGDTWGPGCTERAAEHLARWRRCCEHAPYNVGHLTFLVTSPSNIFPDNFSAIASCSRTNGVYYFLAVSASPALYPDALGAVFAASFFTYQCSSSAASLHFFCTAASSPCFKTRRYRSNH